MRYFADISYLGANYHGWQRQPHQLTVQEVIEAAFSTVLRNVVSITGAGRTDTGVNARKMPAHFDWAGEPLDSAKLQRSLNAILPSDIAVNRIYEVGSEMHARFSALKRTYHYYAIGFKSPFFHNLAWKAPQGLDYCLMNQAAELLLGQQDFTSFSKLHTDVKTNICTVVEAAWKPVEEGWVFTISADRFLRNMVRAIVGTLVQVGSKKIGLSDFQEIINGKDRCLAGTSMPAHALYLWDVEY